jgi:PKD repeat protein
MLRRNLIILLLAGAAAIILLSLGCDDLVTQTIKTDVKLYSIADFTIAPDSGCAPMQVTFKDASSGPIRTWIWNFGDGSASDTITKVADDDVGDVIHSYTTTGSFTVTLTVIDSLNGTDPETKKRAVIVGQNLDSLTLSDTLTCPNEEITFQAYNPFGVATWRWAFGDGTILTDSSLIQTHSYDTPGLYAFTLTVTGECGSLTLTDTIHILPCPQVAFTMDPPEGCAPITIQFRDSTPAITDSLGAVIGAPIAWAWNFGNGTTSSIRYPTARYASGGSYPVTLSVTTDSGGVATLIDTILITESTNADFSFTPKSDCYVPGRQYVVKFTDESTGATSWLWNFSDGYTSTEQNPAHAYLNPGIYTVKLRVNGPCGPDSLTQTGVIEYADSLSETLFRYVISPTDSLTVNFSDTSATSVVVHRRWNFGDGQVSEVDSLDHKYSFTRDTVMQVILTRWNACDSIADTQQVTINVPTP